MFPAHQRDHSFRDCAPSTWFAYIRAGTTRVLSRVVAASFSCGIRLDLRHAACLQHVSSFHFLPAAAAFKSSLRCSSITRSLVSTYRAAYRAGKISAHSRAFSKNVSLRRYAAPARAPRAALLHWIMRFSRSKRCARGDRSLIKNMHFLRAAFVTLTHVHISCNRTRSYLQHSACSAHTYAHGV